MAEPYLDSAKTLQKGEAHHPTAASEHTPLTQIGRYRVEQVLGEGGFGRVYLAFDEQLERRVAVKVPHASLMEQAGDKAAYLSEARTVAQLNHPHIVPVHDVGQTDSVPFYIVTTFVEGGDLARAIDERRFSHSRGASLIATIADALHYAHTRGVVHCDVKPANILIDKAGKPFLVDFGVARREQAGNQGPNYSGTPAYMSPEQASGQGQRVDGRSDVFSLGIVLYELLTRRRPFRGDSLQATLISVCSQEPKPPRQIDDSIPKELERICLNALAKKTSERYTTAKDMASEIREACMADDSTPSGELPPVTPQGIPPDTWPAAAGPQVTPHARPPSVQVTPSTGARLSRVIPKGLREFDADDSDFFLDLLPGPRDVDGVPESVRFWKQKIENTDCDRTFAVGLVYGPTGCGKSSLIRAGLVPRLAEHVTVVYVEATRDATETNLLKEIQRACHGISRENRLEETLATIRHGNGLDGDRKVVLVIDQFEQWLHSHRDDESAELIRGLRHCNGGRVQCVLVVRDDFCMAATGFMRLLGAPLVEDHNSKAVDLFPRRHAKRVLAAIGRAYGDLADDDANLPESQQEFLNEVVSRLAEEGGVNCMRLALFSEMMKGQPWTGQALAAAGGIDGLALRYLEDNFGARTMAPLQRYHQRAAKGLLAALLPDAGRDVRSLLQSESDLIEASGYSDRREAFDELVNLLDIQTGLITPTDPEGIFAPDAELPAKTAANERFFRLTHDFLAPSLRNWLTQQQRMTRRGRAYLRLNERAQSWRNEPEHRQLPSLLEYVNIRILTQRGHWTSAQQTMMRRAGRYHAVKSGIAVVLLVGFVVIGGALTGRMTHREVAENEPTTPQGRSGAQASANLAPSATEESMGTFAPAQAPSPDNAPNPQRR